MKVSQDHNAPKVITKYCDLRARKYMLAGHFKIGLLLDYKKQEAINGMMSDDKEGCLESNLPTPIKNFSGTVEGIHFSDVTLSGFGTTISVQREIEANVFCAALGPYSSATHNDILNGTNSYKGNPSYTEFIELDVDTLTKALVKADSTFYDSPINCFRASVIYGDRKRVIGPNNINEDFSPNRMEEEKLRTIFTKPKKFRPEREYRIAFARKNNGKPWQIVWTRESSPDIQLMLQESIIRSGSVRNESKPHK